MQCCAVWAVIESVSNCNAVLCCVGPAIESVSNCNEVLCCVLLITGKFSPEERH